MLTFPVSAWVVDRPEMLDPAKVQEGDVLIGLASSGITQRRVPWIHRVVTDGKTLYHELRMPQESLGSQSVLDHCDRLASAEVRSSIRQLPGFIRSLAHITGGIAKNLNRALPRTWMRKLRAEPGACRQLFRLCAAQLIAMSMKPEDLQLEHKAMVLVVDPSKVDPGYGHLGRPRWDAYRCWPHRSWLR